MSAPIEILHKEQEGAFMTEDLARRFLGSFEENAPSRDHILSIYSALPSVEDNPMLLKNIASNTNLIRDMVEWPKFANDTPGHETDLDRTTSRSTALGRTSFTGLGPWTRSLETPFTMET